jgi:ubiquinone/menaquinone biosynthesis C-methylase UbiE
VPTQYVERVADQFTSEANYWDDTYAGSDVRSLIYRRRRDVMLGWVDDLRLSGGACGLDLGAGAGHATVALARRGVRMEAVDITQAMAALVQKNAALAGVDSRVAARVAEAYALSYADASFDLAIALGVLPWLDRPAAALAEMHRVVRPGGHLIVSTANRWKLTYRFDPLFSQDLMPIKRPIRALLERAGRWPSSAPQSFLLSLREADQLLDTAGFRRLVGTTLGFGPFTFLGRRLFSRDVGARVHTRLQDLADRHVAGLDSGGTEYLLLARRT